MADKNPPVQFDSKERVIIDLMAKIMAKIAENEGAWFEKEAGTREYWLKLYNQCRTIIDKKISLTDWEEYYPTKPL